MTVDRALHFYMSHINVIIEALFILVILAVGFYIFLALRSEKPVAAGVGTNFSDLEELLRKALERSMPAASSQAAVSLIDDDESPKPANVPAPAVVNSNAGGGDSIELTALKAAVSDRDKMIEGLKSQMSEFQTQLEKAKAEAEAASATGGAASKVSQQPGVDVAAFESRIKDLEAKLAEYEIIEDDIANLSLYKEENARLKDEVGTLKEQMAKGPVVEVPPVVADESLIAAELAGLADVTPDPEGEEAILNELIAEAESAPAGTAQAESETATAGATLEPTVAPDPVAELNAIADQLLQEEAPTNESAVPTNEPTAPTMEASAPAAPTVPSALQVDLNADTVLAELEEFEKQGQSVGDEGGDEGAKLLAEFENFVEGEGKG